MTCWVQSAFRRILIGLYWVLQAWEPKWALFIAMRLAGRSSPSDVLELTNCHHLSGPAASFFLLLSVSLHSHVDATHPVSFYHQTDAAPFPHFLSRPASGFVFQLMIFGIFVIEASALSGRWGIFVSMDSLWELSLLAWHKNPPLLWSLIPMAGTNFNSCHPNEWFD